ncbi:hypothetical protein Poly59_36200 [Rubripirellula reticaptiva]|uniref:Uncharacterized protein n=1 Tax=Rubripirellula reticaptiva TaxID=2528013 RepID=A0A5C6EQG7_9BACT|nr:hypothetical protein Poly59_36200 [Rubripirellula reticaptiva]
MKSTDLCLGIKTGENRVDSVVIPTEPEKSRPAPADGFRWKLAPRYPKICFASGYDFFVVRDSDDFAVRTVICASSLDKFNKDAKLVAFDQHGKRLTARGVESKGIDGITMKMFRFPNEAPNVSLIGIKEPIAQ